MKIFKHRPIAVDLPSGIRPRGLLRELLIGAMASIAIGTGFSLLAGALVVTLASQRLEPTQSTKGDLLAWSQYNAMVSSPSRR